MNSFFTRPGSISGKGDPGKEIAEDLSFIVRKEQLSALGSEICNTVKLPITIIDLGLALPERTDSDNTFFAMRKTCETLRACTNHKLCIDCDDHHAGLFQNLPPNLSPADMVAELENSVKSFVPLAFFSKEYQSPVPLLFKADPNSENPPKDRAYLQYLCPMLGYREIVLPVIIEGAVMGVLFMGQIEHKDDEEQRTRIRDDFLDNRKEHYYEPYCEACRDKKKIPEEWEAIQKRIVMDKQQSQDPLPSPYGVTSDERLHTLNEEKFVPLMEKACRALDTLEAQLTGIAREKRKRFAVAVLNDIDEKFYAGFPSLKELTYNQRGEAKTGFSQCLKEIVKAFDLERVEIFSTQNRRGMEDAHLTYYDGAGGGLDNTGGAERYKSNFSSGRPFVARCSLQHKELFEGFTRAEDRADTDNKVLLVYPSWAARFSVKNLADPYMRERYGDLFDVMTPYFTGYVSALSAMHASYLRNKFELTLHMHKHECTHIAKNMGVKQDEIANFPIHYPAQLKKLIDEMGSNIILINNIAYIIGSVLGTLEKQAGFAHEEYIDVYKELLLKWRLSYDRQLAEKNAYIYVPGRKEAGDRPEQLKANKQLLEIIVYNLVDNAVKYCYWGTNIVLDYRRYREDSQVCLLTVTSYGPEVKGDKIYDPFYRQTGNGQPQVEGDGLGLYMVKQLAKILGMEINHTSKSVSQFNVPLIDAYLNRDFKYQEKDASLIQALKEERNKIPHWRYSKVVNQYKSAPVSDFDIAEEDIVLDIGLPTYETTFSLEVPTR